MFIRNPKQRKSITLSERQGALKTRRHQQTGELLWWDTGGIHWRMLASRSGSTLAGHLAGFPGKGYSAGYSAGSTGGLLWDTQRDTRRDPLAGSGGILASYSGGILGGIHWRATLRHSTGYSAGSTAHGGPLLRDTRQDPLASALAGYSAGSTGEPL